MTKRKSTLRALLMSALSLLMCVSMLVGSTFAWFTDSVTSGSNVITAGNLDIEVTYTLGDTDSNGEYIWNNLDGAIDLFQKGLWEPGHTEVVVLRIENKGTLAAKYEAQMNIVEEKTGKTKDGKDIVLSDILTVETNVVAEDKQFASNNDTALYVAFNWEEMEWLSTPVPFKSDRILNVARQNAGVNDAECTMLLPGDAHYVVVMVDMDETVDNEANHDGVNVPSIEFGINVLATQYAYEYDSFGNQYDKDAEIPVLRNIVLAENSSDAIVIASNEIAEIDMTNVVVSNSLTNYGEATVTGGKIDVDATGFENHGDATLNDVVVDAGTPGTTAYGYAVNVYAGSNTVLTDVTVNSANGAIGVTGGAELTFNSGSVEVASESTSGRYLFYVVDEGSVVTINGGNFDFNKTQNQKRAYAYVGSGATLYITGGTFGTASARSGYTAGLLGDGTIIITGGTFGFDPSAWVATGYGVVENNGVWTVVEN